MVLDLDTYIKVMNQNNIKVSDRIVRRFKNKMVYQEVNPGIWSPQNDGDMIEGEFISREDDVGENKSMLYALDTKEGIFNVWGSTILDSRLRLVKIGERIRITFKGLGERKGGKNPPKIFKVEVDKKEPEAIQPKEITMIG